MSDIIFQNCIKGAVLLRDEAFWQLQHGNTEYSREFARECIAAAEILSAQANVRMEENIKALYGE